MRNHKVFPILLFAITFAICSCKTRINSKDDQLLASPLYMYEDIETRWNSFENPTSGKGTGGSENKGAKGHPYDYLKAGESKVLMDVKGPGIITRMWFTIRERSPQMLRSLRLDMYWDGSDKPAVSVPFGDFFGNGLGRLTAHENALFANPEGRSFNCFIPMPFKSGAKVVLTNEANTDLTMIFYDINFVETKRWNPDNLYFHCYWNRDTATIPGVDYAILPIIDGKGRFLGVSFGVLANPLYEKSWWGEGEVKMYLDHDSSLPTLVGTGTEDYIGTAWGQGAFINRFTGCTVADTEKDHWAFYRFHIPDPVMFRNNIRVTIHAMGGNMKSTVTGMIDKGVPLIPVTIQNQDTFLKLLDMQQPVDLKNPSLIDGWTNFYRSDDWSSTAYFYLDKPASNLPPLAGIPLRVSRLD